MKPQVIVGSRVYIRDMQAAWQRVREADYDCDFRDALADCPTHYVTTIDGMIGMGDSFAEAFSDLVTQDGARE